MEERQASKLGIAIAASLGIHLVVMVFAEVTSRPAQAKPVSVPPVEISRIVAEGSPLPDGKGDSTFNSRASIANPGFGPKYDLDAGVPSNIPIPPNQPSVDSQSQQMQSPPNRPQTPRTESTGFPVYAGQPNPRTQPNNVQPKSPAPDQDRNNADGNPPPSTPSRGSSAGNQGAQRSRGPNRIAFPMFTVEPEVPSALVTSGVDPSVDVSVDIAADGSHSDKIVRSSGSNQVDDLVLAALKQWKWDPAARDGNPIASTQNFKFNFKPR